MHQYEKFMAIVDRLAKSGILTKEEIEVFEDIVETLYEVTTPPRGPVGFGPNNPCNCEKCVAMEKYFSAAVADIIKIGIVKMPGDK